VRVSKPVHLPKPTSTDAQPQAVKPNSTAIKLSILTQFFPPDFAPTGQLIDELARQLESQGFQVEIFTSQPGYAFQRTSAPAQEQIGNLSLRRSHTASLWPKRIRGKAVNGLLFSLRSAFYLMRTARSQDVILLTTAPPFLPVLGYLIHCLWGTSYVCLIYDLYPDIAINLQVIQPHHWLTKFWNAVNNWVWHHAENIIVLSSNMRDRLLDQHPDLKSKISIIHNWADPDRITPLAKHRNWFAWKHNLVETFTVLYSGNLGRCHDIKTLLDTATLLQHDPIQFVVIGSGARYWILQDQVIEMGLKNIQFLPYQDLQDLPYSLTACDLALVSISPNMESLVAPSKFYSALAASRPVAAICAPHSYLTALIAKATCGKAFQNGDSRGLTDFIRFLSQHPEQGQKMGQAGRRYLQTHFTPKSIAYQYAQVLRQAAFKSE
jgi:glycosyltransferase involved in cell wall biosynthesis